MRYEALFYRVVSAGIALLVAVGPASAQTVVKEGQPAPTDGILFDAAEASKIWSAISDGESCKVSLDLFTQKAAELESKVKDQAESLQHYKAAVKVYEEANKVLDDLTKRMAQQLERDARSMERAEKAAELALKAAERADKSLEKAEDRIQAANSRGFWATVISFAAGIFLGPVAGGLLR